MLNSEIQEKGETLKKYCFTFTVDDFQRKT